MVRRSRPIEVTIQRIGERCVGDEHKVRVFALFVESRDRFSPRN